ncbi:MAG: hypothetical protein A2506_08110 [Elusimicrobia bacterium RIFOXYD12_FULL_66_9]|nr:MAG: hypothetical protein A2506_08110 [Elusimicrobia bacterium RIFOXYD12_FULL_66_9]
MSLFAAVLALNFLSAARASAEETRVVDDEIVLMDPTVSAPRKWAVGGAFEGWYMNGPWVTNINGQKASEGTIAGGMPGGNVFFGYDNFTLQYSRRDGKFDVKRTFTPYGSTYYAPSHHSTQSQHQVEDEVTLRYLWKLSPKFNPYLLAGYNKTVVDIDEVYYLASGARSGRIDSNRSSYSSGLVGVGAIVPFNRRVGIRGDGRLLFTSGKYVNRRSNYSATSSGVGGAATGTVYFNVFEGFNLQAGFKGQVLNGGEKVTAFGRFGIFASAGYSYKF